MFINKRYFVKDIVGALQCFGGLQVLTGVEGLVFCSATFYRIRVLRSKQIYRASLVL